MLETAVRPLSWLGSLYTYGPICTLVYPIVMGRTFCVLHVCVVMNGLAKYGMWADSLYFFLSSETDPAAKMSCYEVFRILEDGHHRRNPLEFEMR
jgi:hypothetical protein